jgi:hypothetical protein
MKDVERAVAILMWGRRFRATWRVEDGEVVVVSDYGEDREPLNGAEPQALAARLFKEIVLKNAR